MRWLVGLVLLLIAVNAEAQIIFPPGPSGGGVPVGGSCATANGVAAFTASTTLGCSGVVASSGAVSSVTTLSMSGQLTNTVSTGSAPFVVSSTTVVGNLNVSQLLGATWASPLAIGSTTPAAITGTTITANTSVSTPLETIAAAANTVPLTISGYSLTGSNTSSLALLSGTLNTSGVVDVIKLAITDTAHGAGSNLLALYAGSAGTTAKFLVDPNGFVAINGAAISTSAALSVPNGGRIWGTSGGAALEFRSATSTPSGIRITEPAGNLTSNSVSRSELGIDDVVFAPTAGTNSFAAIQANYTVNGTSTGTAYGIGIASITNTLTTGKQKPFSAGTTTTDLFTGYTPLMELWVSGGLALGGTTDPGAGNFTATGAVTGATGVFSTSTTSPLIIGGSGTTQTLTYKTTTGNGASGADHIFVVGNNGGTEALRIKNDASITVGGTATVAAATCTVAVTSITVKNGLVTAVSGTGC